jgi:hypothetical protein
MDSISIIHKDKFFVFISNRGTFSKNEWGDSFTKEITGAHCVIGLAEALNLAKQINSRLGKQEVTAKPAADFMELRWGFEINAQGVSCVRKYFAPDVSVIAEIPEDNFKYARKSALESAYADPKIAWECLRSKSKEDYEWYLERSNVYKNYLDAANRALNGEEPLPTNVVSIKDKK